MERHSYSYQEEPQDHRDAATTRTGFLQVVQCIAFLICSCFVHPFDRLVALVALGTEQIHWQVQL